MATASIGRVERDQRFTREDPCPICLGWQYGGKGRHCYGHFNKDRTWAFCTEIGGGTLEKKDGADTYAHRLDGPCRCGDAHGMADAPRPQGPQAPPAKPPKRVLHALIPHTLRDGWHETARFPYHDAGGELLYLKVRYDPPSDRSTEKKRVLSWQPVGDQWAADEEGLTDRKVLYRLPELLASPATRTVFIPEGEKCVEALRALGLVATTNPDGAGKWHVILPGGSQEALRGHHVVIPQDNDGPGREHAAQVAATLAGVAKSVRVVELPGLPEGGDVVDWLDAGGTKDDLWDLVIATADAGQQTTGTTSEGSTQQEEAQAAREREAALKAANVRMNARLRWPERVNAAPATHLRASEAKVAIALRHHIEANAYKADADGFVPTFMQEISLAASVTGGTASKCGDSLAGMGAFRKKSFKVVNARGEMVDRVAFALGDLVDAPEQWVPPDGPRQARGGVREGAGAKPHTCRKCGGEHVQITEQDWVVTEQTTLCPDCGEETRRQVGPRRPAGPPRIVETQDSIGFPFEYSNGNGVGDAAGEGDTPHPTLPCASEREQCGNGVGEESFEVPPETHEEIGLEGGHEEIGLLELMRTCRHEVTREYDNGEIRCDRCDELLATREEAG